jgi:lipoate-protein ligase B
VCDFTYLKKDIHLFLRQLEEAVIDTLSGLGIRSRRIKGLTGVWVESRKICSIGIAVKRWISFHGLSINIKREDLENFRLIKPCGMDIEMTSVETVLGKRVEIDDIKQRLVDNLKDSLSAMAG